MEVSPTSAIGGRRRGVAALPSLLLMSRELERQAPPPEAAARAGHPDRLGKRGGGDRGGARAVPRRHRAVTRASPTEREPLAAGGARGGHRRPAARRSRLGPAAGAAH